LKKIKNIAKGSKKIGEKEDYRKKSSKKCLLYGKGTLFQTMKGKSESGPGRGIPLPREGTQIPLHEKKRAAKQMPGVGSPKKYASGKKSRQ